MYVNREYYLSIELRFLEFIFGYVSRHSPYCFFKARTIS